MSVLFRQEHLLYYYMKRWWIFNWILQSARSGSFKKKFTWCLWGDIRFLKKFIILLRWTILHFSPKWAFQLPSKTTAIRDRSGKDSEAKGSEGPSNSNPTRILSPQVPPLSCRLRSPQPNSCHRQSALQLAFQLAKRKAFQTQSAKSPSHQALVPPIEQN